MLLTTSFYVDVHYHLFTFYDDVLKVIKLQQFLIVSFITIKLKPIVARVESDFITGNVLSCLALFNQWLSIFMVYRMLAISYSFQ